MKNKRVIARIDVKNNALVKGIHLEGLRVLGKPEEFAEKYYKDGADEIIYMDVVASLYERNSLVDLVKTTAKNIFIPLTVGGGIRTLSDVKELLSAGADKVCINTAAVRNPELISKISDVYGSSTVVIAIEAIKTDNCYKVFIDNGREYTGLDVVEWAKKVEKLGAGEILLTSVDNEGTGKGPDLELINLVKDRISIPLIVHGGIGTVNDIYDVFINQNIDAVCAASIFHYDAIKEMGDIDMNLMGNKSFLASKNTKQNMDTISITNAKNKLKNMGVKTR